MNPNTLILYTERHADGSVRAVRLGHDLHTWIEDERAPLQGRAPLRPGALEAIFRRYGKPLDPDIPHDLVASLTLPIGTLSHLRVMHFGDVYKTDWLSFSPPSGDTLAAPAPLVSAALLSLSF